MRINSIEDNETSCNFFTERYLKGGETISQRFFEICDQYARNPQAMLRYISMGWFMPSTPILINGGRGEGHKGLPISCFLNEVDDTIDGISDTFSENVYLATLGGGIGTYWGNVRSISEDVGVTGHTSGIIPFIKVQDSWSLAISQGNFRRGSSAAYLDIHHPEIEEFIDIRRTVGGDQNRRCHNVHHGVCITDKFINAVEKNLDFELISPKSGEVIKSVKARDLWIKILTSRLETGEPYMVFIDNMNKSTPYNVFDNLYDKGEKRPIKTSNLCSEIALRTGKISQEESEDISMQIESFISLNNGIKVSSTIAQQVKTLTAVCCLGSVNLEYFDQWKEDDNFICECVYFLDRVLDDFIKRAPIDKMLPAIASSIYERNIGLGVMGYHSLLQKKFIAFDSNDAKSINKEIFKEIDYKATIASESIGTPAPIFENIPYSSDSRKHKRANLNITAIAPTATISIINSCTSPGIEPIIANVFNHKTIGGTFTVKNKYLEKLLKEKRMDKSHVWSSITQNNGSVQHLDFLSNEEKNVFKTAFEINQNAIIEQAAERQPFIHQSQSLNLFIKSDIDKKTLHDLHLKAAKTTKSLYYLRSMSVQRPENISNSCSTKEECSACQ